MSILQSPPYHCMKPWPASNIPWYSHVCGPFVPNLPFFHPPNLCSLCSFSNSSFPYISLHFFTQHWPCLICTVVGSRRPPIPQPPLEENCEVGKKRWKAEKEGKSLLQVQKCNLMINNQVKIVYKILNSQNFSRTNPLVPVYIKLLDKYCQVYGDFKVSTEISTEGREGGGGGGRLEA